MKTYLNFTVLLILISTTIGFSQKGHVTYEFANGGSISFTKEEYDSLMASRKNPESLVASSEEQEQLLQFYYKKRDKALKNIINQPVTDFDAKDTEGGYHQFFNLNFIIHSGFKHDISDIIKRQNALQFLLGYKD